MIKTNVEGKFYDPHDSIMKNFEELHKDDVNQPDHYVSGGIETIDFIRSKLTNEQFEGFCLGNALKYLSRAGKKESASKDKSKAEWYLRHLRTGEKKI